MFSKKKYSLNYQIQMAILQLEDRKCDLKHYTPDVIEKIKKLVKHNCVKHNYSLIV